MPAINLRPWRQERQAEKQRQFFALLVGFVMVALLCVFIQHRWLTHRLSEQHKGHNYLLGAVASLETKAKEGERLKLKRDRLFERMRAMQKLQSHRPLTVHIFAELVHALPDGIYYKMLFRQGDVLSIQGHAESNEGIATLLRRLDDSTWFTTPNLLSVRAAEVDGNKANDFYLTVTQQAVVGR
jgi:type IV pilus assembly protein PilN